MNTRSRFSSTFTILLSGTALALAAAACSSSDDENGNGGNGGPVGGYTLDNVCEETAKKECAALQSCCDSTGIGYDQTGCEATARKECDKQVAKVKAGKLSFNASAVNACAAVMQGLYQKCTFTYADLAASSTAGSACAQVFEGTVDEGGACEADEVCKQPSDPQKAASCDEGKCVVGPLFLAEGDDCDGDVACGVGLFCDESMKCKKSIAIGDTCDPMNFSQCGLGNYCDGESKKCTVGKAAGAGCYLPVECASFSCDDGKCGAGFSLADEETCKGEEDGSAS